jgi:hypothetical protein
MEFILIYILNITFTRSTNFQNSPTPTRRRKKPPIYRLQHEGSYNSINSPTPTRRQLSNPLVYRNQPKGSSNSLDVPYPTGRRLQPPIL